MCSIDDIRDGAGHRAIGVGELQAERLVGIHIGGLVERSADFLLRAIDRDGLADGLLRGEDGRKRGGIEIEGGIVDGEAGNRQAHGVEADGGHGDVARGVRLEGEADGVRLVFLRGLNAHEYARETRRACEIHWLMVLSHQVKASRYACHQEEDFFHYSVKKRSGGIRNSH